MNKDIAKTRLLDLYKIAYADGKIVHNEYRFLIDIAHQIGLTENDVLDIINKNIDFNILPPKSINERMQHLFQMLYMMKIDGVIRSQEIEIIKNTALFLGLNLSMTDELIEIISKYKQQLVPQEELIRVVKLHMN